MITGDRMISLASYMPARIVCGKNCVRENASLLASLGNKCLIVTGGSGAEKSGALADCMAALESVGVAYERYGKIEPNPTAESCLEAGALARETGADFIVGVGGGSAQDAAKAVAIFAANPSMTVADIYTRTIPAKRLPVALIGTTAGTGSEVTGVSVLTGGATGRKKSISGPDCYAAVSFCDYRYTLSVPFDTTVSTALDAYCHAVEAYLASSCNDLVALYALKAVGLLCGFVGAPEEAALTEATREALYIGSLYAGLAINVAGTDFPHTVGYYLTETYGVPHGKACAVFMPVLIERAKKYCPEKLGAIEEITGCEATEFAMKIKRAAAVDVAIGREEAEAAAQRWSAGVKNFDRSPGGFTVEDAVNALVSIGN